MNEIENVNYKEVKAEMEGATRGTKGKGRQMNRGEKEGGGLS